MATTDKRARLHNKRYLSQEVVNTYYYGRLRQNLFEAAYRFTEIGAVYLWAVG